MIYIISGAKNEGKTTLCQKLFQKIRQEGQTPCGLYSPKVYKNNTFLGYNLHQIEEKNYWPLARTEKTEHKNVLKMGRFYFFKDSFDLANHIMLGAIKKNKGPLFLDEIGQLEFAGHGFSRIINRLLLSPQQDIYFSIREENIPPFLSHYTIKSYEIIKVSQHK